jgi:vacuolar-type H+-ATPase subunit I/STV1
MSSRKTHAEEYANQQRQKAEQAARKAEEKARRAETKRLEKLAKDERKRREEEHHIHQLETAREEYNSRWVALLASVGERTEGGDLAFHDIPWPVVDAYTAKVEDFTATAISWFLFREEKRDRKERLRETILRFHPDKFVGRFIRRIREEDQERVLQGIGQVSRILNTLLS